MSKRTLIALLLFVAACGGGKPDTYGDWTEVGTNTWYAEFTLPTGKTIPCVVWSGYQAGGMSCDWSDR